MLLVSLLLWTPSPSLLARTKAKKSDSPHNNLMRATTNPP